MEKFINHLIKNNYSKNTIRTYKNVLNQYKNDFEDIRLIKKRIKKYFDSPNTAQLHYNVVLSFFKFKKDKRMNQLKLLKLPSIPYRYLEVFSKNFLMKKTEIKELDSNEMISKKMTIRFLFETGIRAEELSNIIAIKKSTLTIKGKGNKLREIFYNEETFKKMPKFIYSTKTLRLWVKELLGDQYTPHSIRRSHATHMLLSGANPKTVMLQLGHAKIETTFRYLQLDLKTNKNIYKKYF